MRKWLERKIAECWLGYPYGCPLAVAMLSCTNPAAATGGAPTVRPWQADVLLHKLDAVPSRGGVLLSLEVVQRQPDFTKQCVAQVFELACKEQQPRT